jgi:prophage regulatory protein
MHIIDLTQLMNKIPFGKSTIYAYVKAGKMPAPIKLGDRAVGWIEAEIDAWLEERIRTSRTTAKESQ